MSGMLLVIVGGILFAALIGTAPRAKADEQRKPLSALQVDALKERFPDGILDAPYRFKTCRNEVWWFFYANHDALPSRENCW